MNTTAPINTAGPTAITTGQVPAISYASTLYFNTQSVSGAWSYLWSVLGTTLYARDPTSGTVLYAIANCSLGGTSAYDSNGDLLHVYLTNYGSTTNPNMYLQEWNSTEATSGAWSEGISISQTTASGVASVGDATRPYNFAGTFNGNNGWSFNVSVPVNPTDSVYEVLPGHEILGGQMGNNNATGPVVPGYIWTISLVPGQVGTLMSNVTFTPPRELMDPSQDYIYGPYATTTPGAARMAGPYVYAEDNAFFYWEGATREMWGFNLTTGTQIWGPTAPQDPWMMYGVSFSVVNGILYTSAPQIGGEIAAYNIATGQNLWTYLSPTLDFETPYDLSPCTIACIGGGMIYTFDSEHSPTMPIRRDATVTCLNMTNGNVLWQLPNYKDSADALADGYLITSNLYDGNWYCIGKGPECYNSYCTRCCSTIRFRSTRAGYCYRPVSWCSGYACYC